MEQGGLQPADKTCMEQNDQVNYSKNALQFKSILMTRLDAKRNKACKDSKLTNSLLLSLDFEKDRNCHKNIRTDSGKWK